MRLAFSPEQPHTWAEVAAASCSLLHVLPVPSPQLWAKNLRAKDTRLPRLPRGKVEKPLLCPRLPESVSPCLCLFLWLPLCLCLCVWLPVGSGATAMKTSILDTVPGEVNLLHSRNHEDQWLKKKGYRKIK